MTWATSISLSVEGAVLYLKKRKVRLLDQKPENSEAMRVGVPMNESIKCF